MAKIVNLQFDEEINPLDLQDIQDIVEQLQIQKGFTIYSEYSPSASVSVDSGLPFPNRPTKG